MAFGWTDSHLYRFALGPSHYSPHTEYYLCPLDVEEGEAGVPEEEVRLDAVLAEPGDRLLYAYDFGDDWQHVVRLEAVLARGPSAPRAVCTGGRRPGPAEACGGVHSYELIMSATDPTNTDHLDATAELFPRFGNIDLTDFRPIPFDMVAINKRLAGLWNGN